MFEKAHQKPISRKKFAHRILQSLGLVLLVVLASLVLGIAGYHYIENFSWIDSLLNASMILGGMGEIDPLKTDAGKIFASIYAIYSGLVIVASTGILLAPVIHRVMHTFHVKEN
jgi:hypothetical protein